MVAGDWLYNSWKFRYRFSRLIRHTFKKNIFSLLLFWIIGHILKQSKPTVIQKQVHGVSILALILFQDQIITKWFPSVCFRFLILFFWTTHFFFLFSNVNFNDALSKKNRNNRFYIIRGILVWISQRIPRSTNRVNSTSQSVNEPFGQTDSQIHIYMDGWMD